MGKRSHRFDEEDLMVFFTEALTDRGYLGEDEEIVGFEYRTKRVKKGGWYHEDASNLPDEQVEVVRWIKVHTAERKQRVRRDPEAEEPIEKLAAEAPAPPAVEPVVAPVAPAEAAPENPPT